MVRNIFGVIVIAMVFLFLYNCNPNPGSGKLPYLGNHLIENGDTTYHEIPDFTFVNQDSTIITNETFNGKAYVADFFFTSCPTICPKVKKQMLRIYDKYQSDDRLLLLSHTIDTKYDTVGRLHEYAGNLGVTSDKWHFVTGEKEDIYGITESYMSIAIEDPNAPGGFDHSGWLILIDKDRRIRSFCNGTEQEAVTKFMQEIDLLMNEY